MPLRLPPTVLHRLSHRLLLALAVACLLSPGPAAAQGSPDETPLSLVQSGRYEEAERLAQTTLAGPDTLSLYEGCEVRMALAYALDGVGDADEIRDRSLRTSETIRT